MTNLHVEDELAERRLLRQMGKGERRAFDQFIALYSPGLWRYAQGHLAGHRDAVPDIVQSTLTAAVEQIDSFRRDGPLGAWLIGICRFQIATYWRRHDVRRRWAAGPDVELERVESGEVSPTSALEERERAACVHSTLDLLPPPYGEVLEWKYLEELSVKEIACRLDVSPKAAESTLTRARNAFRRLFAAAEPSWGKI